MITHQATQACPKCGSWYRNVDKCNICGNVCNDPPHNEQIWYKSRDLKRLWNKKLHRYLTQDEIKRGMKGG